MRSFIKIAVPVVAATLALGACGTKAETPTASGGGATCGLEIGFFGALSGDAANLGINIKQGAELAVQEYNAKHADCTVKLVTFDSQGDPSLAPALAQQAVKNPKLVGIVGPAFSGESKAADPIFNQAGMPLITPSATNPSLSEQGWTVFHRGVGSDSSQGPAAAKYIKDTLKSSKAFVVDDSSEYGKGLADIVRKDLGTTVVGNDQVQQKKTDFSATVTKINASGADTLFYGGYYAEAAIIAKQLRDAGWKGTIVAADGVRDDGYIKAGGAAAEGTILTCPCLPPDKAPEFLAAYQKAFNVAAGTYSAEAYDGATAFLAAIAGGADTPKEVNEFLKTYEAKGVASTLGWTDRGEPKNVAVWAYKVEGGKIVPVEEIK